VSQSTFNLKNFWQFCSSLRIDTKERGLITLAPENLLGTQRYVIEEIAKGLDAGCHYFVILKGRQLGITTISLALDLYWHFKHSGMSGSLVTHDEESRDMFRATLSMYMDGLPREFKQPVESHNRTQLVLKNRSRMAYQVAGTRKKGALGRGKAITFLHSTETSSYGDEEGLASLESSLAEHNPNRLYIFETTARGYNMFYEMWETAKSASTQRAIFVGWWLNQFYRVKKGSAVYNVYWDKRLTPQERKWVREIKQLYDVEIDDEQIAWWRWKMAEVVKDETLMLQEFPPTEEYAFVLSGSQFFNSARINDEYKIAKAVPHHNYRFVLREHFENTELDECGAKVSNLKIWEFPVSGAYYVLGADPAYGSSEWADRFCASLWRCYADGMEQVAEFCTSDCSTYQFAWVICYLAGAYPDCMVNLEINGPGGAVWTEMQNLKRMAATQSSGMQRGLFNVVSQIQNYLYKRPDTFGNPSAYHFKTTYDTKLRMLNTYKDNFERGLAVVRSKELLDEMKNVVQEDGAIGAPGRGKDDRVIGAGLATMAWQDFIRMRLVAAGVTKQKAAARAAGSPERNPVSDYLKRIGIANG
jgi:hypothetical protein